MHDEGTPVIHGSCGKPALIYVGGKEPRWGQLIASKDFRWPNGEPTVFGDPMICPECLGMFIVTLDKDGRLVAR